METKEYFKSIKNKNKSTLIKQSKDNTKKTSKQHQIKAICFQLLLAA